MGSTAHRAATGLITVTVFLTNSPDLKTSPSAPRNSCKAFTL